MGGELSVPAEGVATPAGIRSGMFLRAEKWNFSCSYTHVHSLGRGAAGSNIKRKLKDFCLGKK